jgi:hypothetical protein
MLPKPQQKHPIKYLLLYSIKNKKNNKKKKFLS